MKKSRKPGKPIVTSSRKSEDYEESIYEGVDSVSLGIKGKADNV